MPKNLDLKGSAFVGLKVRDMQASSDFYAKILGLRRDPQVILNGGAAFLTLPPIVYLKGRFYGEDTEQHVLSCR